MTSPIIAQLRKCSAAGLLTLALTAPAINTAHADYYIWRGNNNSFASPTNWWNSTDSTNERPFSTVNFRSYGHTLLIDTTATINGTPFNLYTNPTYGYNLWVLNGGFLTIRDSKTKMTFNGSDSILVMENGTSGMVTQGAIVQMTGDDSGFYVGRGEFGDTDKALFSVTNGGYVESESVTIGGLYNGVQGNGELYLSGTNSQVIARKNLNVGYAPIGATSSSYTPKSYGELNIADRAAVGAFDINIGHLAIGRVDVFNGQLIADRILNVGGVGNGDKSISDGYLRVRGNQGEVVAENIRVGYQGKGAIDIDANGTIRTRTIIVGRFDGDGTLNINEGTLEFENNSGSATALLLIGKYSDNSSVVVSGPNSRIEMRNTNGMIFDIGDESIGTMRIEAGGEYRSLVTTASDYRVGVYDNGVGTLTVTGNGSLFRDDFGYMRVGAGLLSASGTINVTDGGQIKLERLDVGDMGIGTLLVTGANSVVNANDIRVHNTGSTATISAGGRVIANHFAVSADDNYAGGNAVVDGGRIDADNTTVGLSSGGRMSLENGSSLNAETLTLGLDDRTSTFVNAVVEMSSDSTMNITENLLVAFGEKYNARLQVHDGSTVSIGRSLSLGGANNANALVDVAGRFNAISEITADTSIVLGVVGNSSNKLQIRDQARVETDGFMYVGQYGDGENSVSVNGYNSELVVDKGLFVGYTANGDLSVKRGRVSADSLTIGAAEDGHGHVIVNGPNSTIDIANATLVGEPLFSAPPNSTSGRLDLINEGQLNAGNGFTVGENGTLNIWGGTLKTNKFTGHQNANINWSSGLVLLTSNVDFYETSGLDYLLGDSNTLRAGQVLVVDGELNLGKQMTLNGGQLIVNDINGFAGSNMLNFQNGTLGFLYGGDVGNNNNVLGNRLIMKEGMTIATGGTFANNGWISGSGAFTTTFPEHDDIYAYDFGSFYNGINGTLHLDQGDRMFLDVSETSNEGVIEVFDGQLIIKSGLTNRGDLLQFDGLVNIDGQLYNEGQITGLNSHIRANNIVNQGDMDYADTQHLVFGDVKNEMNGKITVTRGARLTLHDDVQNDAVIEIADDASVVIFGALSGSGSITGGGTTYIEGMLTPGHSPGAMTIEGDLVLTEDATAKMELAGLAAGSAFDQVTVDGELVLGGELEVVLLDGFAPAFGHAFQLFNANVLSGGFESLLLPTLGGALSWDTSGLETSGVLKVIPEPTTALFLLSGLYLVMGERRSKRRS